MLRLRVELNVKVAPTGGQFRPHRVIEILAYDAAKRAARLARAKKAHDEVISAVYRAQADALLIEARAKVRLADEDDAAQERGEVQRHGGQGKRDVPGGNIPPTVTDLGLTRKQVHEARQIRDAEKLDPGSVERVLSGRAEAGDEPARAALRKAVVQVVEHGYRGPRVPARERLKAPRCSGMPSGQRGPIADRRQHDASKCGQFAALRPVR